MSSGLKIMVGVPSSGQIQDANVSWLVSHKHPVVRNPSNKSGPNSNTCWQMALNAARRGDITHFAIVHADIEAVTDDPKQRWGDILIDEAAKFDADFISVPAAIKDHRALTTCGVGDPANRWNPFRRFTTEEIDKMPETFGIENTPHPDKYLLHAPALCMWDMRKPLWQIPNPDGSSRFVFNFTERLDLVDGVWQLGVDSEDWAYSRQLWEAGAKTVITRRVITIHQGGMSFPSTGDWGTYKDGDEDTASQWRKEKVS